MLPLVEEVRELLEEAGAELAVKITTGPGDATRLAALVGPSVEAILVVGGDGTVREVVSGLIGASVPMLIMSTGTENLVACELGMPESPIELARTLRYGRPVACDVGEANGRRFLVVVGVGFDAECVRRLAHRRQGHITHWDYFLPIWQTFWTHRFPMLTVHADDELVFEGKGFVLCGNMPRYSVGLRPWTRARYDDGLLDLCVFRCSSKLALLSHAYRLFQRTHLHGCDVIYRQCRRVRVDSPESVAVEIDGDDGGCLPVTCAVMPGAVTFLRL